jgi:predicted NUDIX family NTP pyrophosphohydrolase
MAKLSAGILVYRIRDGKTEVFLGHPGGPFYTKKDDGVWSIPKGEYSEIEDPLSAAKREFREETGIDAPDGEYTEIGQVKASNKIITAWSVEKDLGEIEVISNLVSIDWPPRSGRKMEIPEIDRAGWFDLQTALIKIHAAQREYLHKLADKLGQTLQEADPAKPPDSKPDTSQISLL